MSFLRLPCGAIPRISIYRITPSSTTSIPIHQLRRQFLSTPFRHASTRTGARPPKPMAKSSLPHRSGLSHPRHAGARPAENITLPRGAEPLVLYSWPLSRGFRFWSWWVFSVTAAAGVVTVWVTDRDYRGGNASTWFLGANMFFAVVLVAIGSNFLSNPRAVASRVLFKPAAGARRPLVSVEMRRPLPFWNRVVVEAELKDVSVNMRFGEAGALRRDLQWMKERAQERGETDVPLPAAKRESSFKRFFKDARMPFYGSIAVLKVGKTQFCLAEQGDFLDGGEAMDKLIPLTAPKMAASRS